MGDHDGSVRDTDRADRDTGNDDGHPPDRTVAEEVTDPGESAARPDPVDAVTPVLERYGVTLDEFLAMQEHAARVGRDELADHFNTEQLQMMYEARMAHPHPGPDTVIQKVIGDAAVNSILEQVHNPGSEYGGGGPYKANAAGGCVSVAADAAHLRTPSELLHALRLDYGNGSPYEAFTTTDHAYVIEGRVATGKFSVPNGRITEHLGIDDPHTKDLPNGAPPHTGTGYTGDRHGLNPEYQLTEGKWKPGATLFRIDPDGSRHPVARLENKDTWVSAKEPGDHVVDGWPAHKGGEWVFPDSTQHGLHPDPPDGPAHRGADSDGEPPGTGPLVEPGGDAAAAARAFEDSVFDTEAGAAFFDPADATMRAAAGDVPPVTGEFTVDVHGDANAVIVRDGAGTEHRMSASEFAEVIRNSTGWDGHSPIRLMSCDTGGGPHPFAADLARELGVPVTAPDRPVWSFPDGREPVVTGFDRGPNGELAPRIPPDGGWNRFSPDGTVHRVPDTPGVDRGGEPADGARSRGRGDDAEQSHPPEKVDPDEAGKQIAERTMEPPKLFQDTHADPDLINDPRLRPDDLPIGVPEHSPVVSDGPHIRRDGSVVTRFDDGTLRVETRDRVDTTYPDGTVFTEWPPREVTAPDGSTVIRSESLLQYPGEPPQGVARSQFGENVARWDIQKGRAYHAEAVVRHDYGGGERTAAESAAATAVGNQAGMERDVGGHMIAHRFMGDQGYRNLLPQDKNLNSGAYKKFENEVAHLVEMGVEDVSMEVYSAGVDPVRPEYFEVVYVTELNGEPRERTEELTNKKGQVYDRRFYDGRTAR